MWHVMYRNMCRVVIVRHRMMSTNRNPTTSMSDFAPPGFHIYRHTISSFFSPAPRFRIERERPRNCCVSGIDQLVGGCDHSPSTEVEENLSWEDGENKCGVCEFLLSTDSNDIIL